MSPKRVALPLDIYVRVSDSRGRSGESFISPKDQEERCRALAKAHGYKVGDVFKDIDVSGGKMSRPELDNAIRRIRDGVSGGIIVAKLDRFARTLVGGLQTLEEINSLDGVVIVADGEFDTSTATGELVLNMMLSLAQFELRRIRDNWQTAKESAVGRGIHVSRHVPPGYERLPRSANGDDRKLVPHPVHGETIAEAFRMAAAGDSYSRIAAYLNERSLPVGGQEGTWLPGRIRRLLANRVYLGEARSGNGVANPNAHEPLTDPVTFQLAQREQTHHGATVTLSATSLLAGICRCASCSFAMATQPPRGRTAAAYRCGGKTRNGHCSNPTAISRDRIERYVIDEFLARAASQSYTPAADDDSSAELHAAMLRAEESYRSVADNVELRTVLGDAEYNHQLVQLKKQWDEAINAAAEVRTSARSQFDSMDLARIVADLQHEGDVATLRELLAASIDAVFVRPAQSRAKNLPVSDRVRIVWKDEGLNLVLPSRGSAFEHRAFAW